MCRNIKTLYNFDPPATDAEIHEASLQFVRKVSGFQKPSQVNEVAFNKAVAETASVINRLFNALKTNAQPHNREVEAERAKARAAKRFGSVS